jgi:1-acyl-sn-glycerol-3-phosphate acyltransferase
MRIFFKILGFVPLFLFYLIVSGIISLIPTVQRIKRLAAIRTTSSCARILLILLGVRVHVKNHEYFFRNSDARLIVSNHLSYLDVLILSSLVPSVFITSVELKNTILLGTLARLSGSIFVERRKASGLKQEIGQIGRVLSQGMHIALFPEGTTSNGDRVQPFKNSLFDAAILAQSDILPICFRYTGMNGEPMKSRDRDNVFYYGGTSFLKHFSKLLALKSIDVEVILLEPVRVQANDSRKDLAATANRAISAAYQD